MAYTTARTWVTSELVTATLLNTHLRDNMTYVYACQAACHAYNAGAQAVTATAVLTFDSEDYDQGGMHSTSVNTSRLTVQTGGGGRYLLTSTFRVSSLGTSTAQAFFRKNGTTALHDGILLLALVNVIHTMALPGVALVDGDYVEVLITKGDASSWEFGAAAGGARSQFGAVRIGG